MASIYAGLLIQKKTFTYKADQKRVQLAQDLFETPKWPPFHCSGTPIWPPWRHVKGLLDRDLLIEKQFFIFLFLSTFFNLEANYCFSHLLKHVWKTPSAVVWFLEVSILVKLKSLMFLCMKTKGVDLNVVFVVINYNPFSFCSFSCRFDHWKTYQLSMQIRDNLKFRSDGLDCSS